MPIYYPSCVVNVTVRFDDAFNVNEDKDVRSVAETTKQAPLIPPPPTIRPLLTSESGPSNQNDVPAGLDVVSGLPAEGGRRRAPLTTVANRIPSSCSVDMPGPRSASTFSLTLAYRDLPIDPRIVKGCSVEIFMGAVDPNDFSTGMVRTEPDGRRTSILNTHTSSGQRRDDLLLVVGVVDSWRVRHTATGSLIEMSGRDLRGRLLDAQVDSTIFAKVDLTKPIDKVVADIVHTHPEFPDLQVIADPNDWPVKPPFTTGQIPPVVVSKSIARHRRKANGQGAISKPQGGAQVNFWDLITHYCFLVGAIPFFYTDKLFIKPAASLYKQRGQDREGATNTPFAGGKQRQVDGGQPFGVRRIVFGRDVLEYSFERKYTGKKRPIVEAVATNFGTDSRGNPRLSAIFPEQKKKAGSSQSAGSGSGRPGDQSIGSPNKSRASHQTPGGINAQDPPLQVPVPGAIDKATLLGVAQAVWEEIGRGELGGSVQTRSLASFGTNKNDPASGNTDPDMLRLRPLDAVEILVDLRTQDSQAPLTSSYVDSRGRREFNEEVSEVAKRLGGNQAARDIARVIVAQSRGGILNLQTFFRVGTAHFQFQAASGIAISFDFQNYIEVVADNLPMPKGSPKPQITSVSRSQSPSRT